jgi:hypothetical protein
VLFTAAGARATRRLVEFFTAEIRNPNTRAAYARAVTGSMAGAPTRASDSAT